MAVDALTRELSVTYNGYTCGSADRQIHGFYVSQASANRAMVAFDVIVTGSSESEFASSCESIEKAYSTPYKDLSVQLGASTLISASQSKNTGLDAIASIDKPGGPPDSGRSRRYRVRIEYGRPATWAATAGLRDSTVTVSKTVAGRAEVRLAGIFTAIGGSDALAQHDAQIDAWSSSQLSWLGITTYELIQEQAVEVSLNRKTCRFERIYRELIYQQAGSNDDSAIREQVLVITRTKRGSEYSPSDGQDAVLEVVPLMDVSAQYTCWLDKDVSTDLESKWDTIENWVIQQIQAILGGKGFGLLAASPSFNYDDNRIEASIVGVAEDPDGTDTVQNTVEYLYGSNPGFEVVPAWTGDPLAALVFQGMAVETQTVTNRVRKIAGKGSAPGPLPEIKAPTGYITLSDTQGLRPIAIGRKEFLIQMQERWRTQIFRKVNQI